MEQVIFLCIFGIIIVLEGPIAFALTIASLGYLITIGTMPLEIIPHRMWAIIKGTALMAVPFYIFAAVIMNKMGVTTRIYNFALCILGHLRGGLGYVNVLASIIFAGISGSNTADASGLGMVEIKAMLDEDYDPGFSAAVTAASSIIGPIIPPSIILVVYGQLASVSTGKLFVGGIIPGVIMGLSMMLLIYFQVQRGKVKGRVRTRANFKELLKSSVDGFLALLSPFIIVGGIIGGIVTPSEAGVLAVIYSLLLAFLYRTFTLSKFIEALEETAVFSGAILFVVSGSGVFGWIINMERIPEMIGSFILYFTSSKVIALILINIGMLAWGCLEAGSAALIVIAPILFHLGDVLNVDPVHLGIFSAINLTMGSLTPPVALSLYISARIAGISSKDAIKAVFPFYIALLFALALVTYIPSLSLYLPNVLMK